MKLTSIDQIINTFAVISVRKILYDIYLRLHNLNKYEKFAIDDVFHNNNNPIININCMYYYYIFLQSINTLP